MNGRLALGVALLAFSAACKGANAPGDAVPPDSAPADAQSAPALSSSAPVTPSGAGRAREVGLASSPKDAGAPTQCTRTFASDAELRAAPEGTEITIETYFERSPTWGRFTLEGFLQAPHHCPPCSPGVLCKPCEEYVFLSTARGAFKHPIADGVDFRISVPDATKFVLLQRYRMTVDVCSNGQRELRGYRELSR